MLLYIDINKEANLKIFWWDALNFLQKQRYNCRRTKKEIWKIENCKVCW